mmetsp:Transcript_19202/g.31463  ORF Transcript_19202/g.31463 Transcript_19202/m.31463 type:complete len:251 (+) Transcript_19202:171-923(+)
MSSMEWQELNSDKTVMVHVDSDELTWTKASQAMKGGVWRKMLERKGAEVARATTIVRFDPHQEFPRHTHNGGEEYVVLAGTWHDDYGTFPAYSYVRNYIGSSHTPKIKEDGCTILVKLRQMSKTWEEPETTSWSLPNLVDLKMGKECGAQKFPLFSSPLERTYVMYFPKGTNEVLFIPLHGLEMFLLAGSLTSELATDDTSRLHNKWSWTRLPNDTSSPQKLFISTDHEDGAYAWIKEGHLDSDEVGVRD